SEDRLPVSAADKRLDKPTHDLHVLLRHRLPPFLTEAFGGSAGLVDVGTEDHPRDHPLCPRDRVAPSFLHPARATSEATAQTSHGKQHSLAEVLAPLLLGLVLLVGSDPVFKKAAVGCRGLLAHQPC